MNTDLSRWVDEASDIRSSGRWGAVNERIKQLCANPGEDNRWWVRVFASLCASVFSGYLSLKHAYEDPSSEASLIAWRARNLLELSVWSIYCSKSQENARRFYADAGRDVLGIFNAFEKWAAAVGQERGDAGAVDQAKNELSSRAVAQGIESLEGAYKQVSEAAKEVGVGAHFAMSNKMLSKFAHPTAMQTLAPPDDAKTAKQKNMFFSYGCLYFVGAFNALEGQLCPVNGDEA